MASNTVPNHERFAETFVREYWLDVIEQPGHEPVTESIDELLASVSYRIDVSPLTGQLQISMRGTLGDVWNFYVRYKDGVYEVEGMDSGSLNLFDVIYGPTFRPMMTRVLSKCHRTGTD